MRTRFLVILGVCFSFLGMEAQNLVPNSSFETYTLCPWSQDQIYLVSPWFRPTANTSDYYNGCSTSYVDVPVNWFGTENAHTGNGYVGFACFYGGNSREYVSTPLLDTLKAGKKYCVSFYVSLADSSLDGISPISAYFSNTLYNNQIKGDTINVTPQVSSPIQTPLSDTSGWTLITGSFTANGGEKYIIIGTFTCDSLLTRDSTIRPRPNNYAKFAYYYLDDVSVIEIADCKAGNDASICFEDSLQLGTLPDSSVIYSWQPSDGLSNSFVANPKASPFSTTTYTLTQTQCNVVSTSTITVTVEHDCNSAPNIFIPTLFYGTGELKVSGLELNSALEIFDARGRKVFSSADYQNDFWTDELAAGVYFVRLIRPNQQVLNWKFCVIK